MSIITYDNIREVESEYMKFVSQKKGKFKINIVRFPEFREELLVAFSEDKICRFFEIFP